MKVSPQTADYLPYLIIPAAFAGSLVSWAFVFAVWNPLFVDDWTSALHVWCVPFWIVTAGWVAGALLGYWLLGRYIEVEGEDE